MLSKRKILEPARCEISVSFVGPDEIQALNSEYRGIDRVTDVLSFPQFAALADEVPEVGEICLGDVVICKDKAEAQAEEFGHSFERELVTTLVCITELGEYARARNNRLQSNL